MKRLLCSILLLSMFAATLVGCGSSRPGEKENTAASTTQEVKVEQKVNEYGWAVPEKTLEINFFQADKDNPDKVVKNFEPLSQYILDKFNVKVTKTVYDTDPVERLNLMLASGEYPEVIVSIDDDNISKWKAQGKILELTPLVEKAGPDIKKALGDLYKRYVDVDGKLWGIPRGWGLLPIPDRGAHIRCDTYTAAGSPKIETPDDYYEFLKKQVAEHPKNEKGEKVYAISWVDWLGPESLTGFWGLKDGYKEDADHNLTHWLNTSEGLAVTKYMNRFSREGLMDPDAFINKFDDWKTKFSNERIVGHIGDWWMTWNAGHEVWQKAKQGWKEDMRYTILPLKAPGVEKAYLSPKDTYGWNYTVLTDKCKNPEEVINFINFTMTPIGTRLISWGIPNTPDSHWNYEGNGKWSFVEKTMNEMINGTYDYGKHELLGGFHISFGVTQAPLPDDNKSVCWYDQNFNDRNKWKKMMNEAMKDTIFDNTARRITFAADNPLTVVNQQIQDVIRTGWVKAITSKTEADCEANFNALRDKLNKAGLHDIEKFRTEQYKKNLEAWK